MPMTLARCRTVVFACGLAMPGPALAQATGGSANGGSGPAPAARPVPNGGAGRQGASTSANGAAGAGGINRNEATRQDRELDSIGKQLLDQTPKNPAGSTLPTGGGTTP